MPTSMVLYGVIVGVSLLCSHQFRYMRVLLYSLLYNYTQMPQVFPFELSNDFTSFCSANVYFNV